MAAVGRLQFRYATARKMDWARCGAVPDWTADGGCCGIQAHVILWAIDKSCKVSSAIHCGRENVL